MTNVIAFPDAHERDRLKSSQDPALRYLNKKELFRYLNAGS